jgi:hypothetical protein
MKFTLSTIRFFFPEFVAVFEINLHQSDIMCPLLTDYSHSFAQSSKIMRLSCARQRNDETQLHTVATR